jgi:hypothetical protein
MPVGFTSVAVMPASSADGTNPGPTIFASTKKQGSDPGF